MEIILKRNDIPGIIITYCKKIEGIDVKVNIFEDNNIDETFQIECSVNDENMEKFIPANEISNMIRVVFNNFGFDVSTVNIDFGGKYKKVKENNQVVKKYVPLFSKVTVSCEFANLKTKTNDDVMTK